MINRFKFLFCTFLLLFAFSNAAAANTLSISGQVIDAQTGQPISGAAVFVDTAKYATTDAAGNYQLNYSVNEAYQLVKIRVRAAGYGVWVMPKVILYPGENRVLPQAQLSSERVVVEDKLLPGIFLRTDADLAAAKSLGYTTPGDSYLPFDADPRSHVSHFVIPMTIKVGITPYVHCSDWLAAGQPITEVIEMDFKEYVKNVLPNEWIYTWHSESLKAGAMAAKTFAWWRMTLTTTRPQGADVVDNTCDQVFWPNSKRPSTDAAVDATWHLRMSRDNLIKVVHYLAYDTQCAQASWYPKEPCMGQWDSKYLAESGWGYQDILHRYYDPTVIDTTTTIIPNINVITNSSFGIDAASWQTWGGIAGAGVKNGVYEFFRQSGSANQATVYQDINTAVPANSPLRVQLLLGNSSNVSKTVNLYLHSIDSWTGAMSCQFVIEPNMPLQPYLMWGSNSTGWPAMRIEIMGATADSLPAYRLDNVNVSYRRVNIANQNPCTPPLPGKPTIVKPVATKSYPAPLSVTLTPGASNLRPNYADAFHIQISTSTSFATPIFDNADSLAPDPVIPVTLPTGAYYIRARQFDGIDRYSKWTAPVAFSLVARPVLISPTNAAVVDVNNFDFQWNKGLNVNAYRLRVLNGTGKVLFTKLFTPSQAKCSGGICTVNISALTTTPTTVFLDDTVYKWDVQVRTPYGNAASGSTFIADIPVIP